MKNLYTLLACLSLAPAANAEITATFVQDESLFGIGNNTYALQVTTDTDWLVGSIDIQMSSGQLLNVPSGMPSIPRPTFDSVNDSGVFARDFAFPILAPDFITTATRFRASWGEVADKDLGTFYIAAFTFSPDANGTLSGRVIARDPRGDLLNPLTYNLEGWSVVNGVMTHTAEPIPEPSTVVMVGLGLAGLGLAIRRK